tara:strand:+ start:14585 stop:16423 length:1839 start_codon:yes stop_codon:yes gene_type:complete
MTGSVVNRVIPSLSAIVLAVAASSATANSVYFGGRIQQGFSLAYGGSDEDVGPSNFLAEVKANYSPNRSWTVIGDVWLRGDLYPDLGGDLQRAGIQDFTSPGFGDQFGFRLNQSGNGQLPVPFGDDAHEIRLFDDFNDEMLRELSARYRHPSGAFAVKVGKFQRGWGQSDGLRLLDVLNAQDLRERLVLRDADELRIPAWMTTLDLDLERAGLAGPFKRLGLRRPKLEFVFTPEVQHSRFIINNPTPSDSASGGIFGFPFPRLIDPRSGLGMPFIGANLTDITPDDFSVKDAEFAVSFSFEALDAEWSIKGFYGQQDFPVVTLEGGDLLIGSPLNDPSGSAAVVELDRATIIGATHGPGQYLDFLNGLATGSPIPFFLEPFGCTDPTAGMPNCSVTFNFGLDYDRRQKMVGMSFTREMRELELGPKRVSPVLRLETSYEFDKPFNVSRGMTPFGTVASGSTALVLDPAASIVERDQWQTMIGVDYFLWLPFWKGQQSSMFTSVQFFNIHTENSSNLMQQAPYAFAEVNNNQNFLTFLWNADLDDGKLFIEGLLIRDFDNHGTAYRQRVDFNYFGDNFRPRVEWIHVSGRDEAGPLGLITDADIIEVSLTYQF